ncbi:hypothetical protein BH11BAC7_BH11BAC7_06800 [soil metagenome]
MTGLTQFMHVELSAVVRLGDLMFAAAQVDRVI